MCIHICIHKDLLSLLLLLFPLTRREAGKSNSKIRREREREREIASKHALFHFWRYGISSSSFCSFLSQRAEIPLSSPTREGIIRNRKIEINYVLTQTSDCNFKFVSNVSTMQCNDLCSEIVKLCEIYLFLPKYDYMHQYICRERYVTCVHPKTVQLWKSYSSVVWFPNREKAGNNPYYFFIHRNS